MVEYLGAAQEPLWKMGSLLPKEPRLPQQVCLQKRRAHIEASLIHRLPGALPAVAKTRQSGQQSCLLPRSSDPRAGVPTLPTTATL